MADPAEIDLLMSQLDRLVAESSEKSKSGALRHVDGGNEKTTAASQIQPPREVLPQSAPGAATPLAPPPANTDEQQVVQIFYQLYRSFRKRCVQILGKKQEEIFSRAEQSVRFLAPDFDIQRLAAGTAPHVLSVIEQVITQVSFLKRQKVREAALVLVTSLYDKNYDLLERVEMLESTEETYCRLKG